MRGRAGPGAALRAMRGAAGAAFVCAVLMGCAGSAPRAERLTPAPAEPGAALLALTRLDAPADGRIVLAVDEVSTFTVTTDDGRVVPASLWRIGVEVPGEELSGAWVPPPGVWSARRVQPGGADTGRGTLVALLEVPREGVGQGVVINGRRVPVQWLPRAEALVTSPTQSPWLPPFEGLSAGVYERLAPEARSPVTRWRYRLLTDGLDPRAEGPGLPAFEDPVIEAIAAQNEARWSVALAWLWSADASTAHRVRARLAMLANLGGGLAPAWPTDHGALDRLLSDLLNPAATPERRRLAGENWLAAQARGVAWVIDDAGTFDAHSGRALATVGVVNLSLREEPWWIEDQAGVQGPMRTARPGETVETLALERGAGVAPAPLSVHLGPESFSVTPVARRLPLLPPGLAVQGFWQDWTLEAWSAGRSAVVDPAWGTAAYVHNAAAPGEGARWEVLVECASRPGVGDRALEGVELFMGPFGRAVCRVRVSRAGVVSAVPAGVLPEAVEVREEGGTWSFRLPLPGAATEEGTLRLGVTRVDALGRRSAWPRAMLPWQGEPGRAAFDLEAWSGLPGANGR